jgi:hypothetical protein
MPGFLATGSGLHDATLDLIARVSPPVERP